MDMALGDQRFLSHRRSPALRPPCFGRHAIAEGAAHHEDEINASHYKKGLPDAHRVRCLEILHEKDGERRADHGAAAEAHDGHPGRHAAAVREPPNQG